MSHSQSMSEPMRRAIEIVKQHGRLTRWPNDVWHPKRVVGWHAYLQTPNDGRSVRGSTVRALIKRQLLEFRDGAARLPRETTTTGESQS